MPCKLDAEGGQPCMPCVVSVGLLANLTCIQAELYQMQEAMSTGQNPLWVVPYRTVSADYQELLDDFVTYAQVSRDMPGQQAQALHYWQDGQRSLCHSAQSMQLQKQQQKQWAKKLLKSIKSCTHLHVKLHAESGGQQGSGNVSMQERESPTHDVGCCFAGGTR